MFSGKENIVCKICSQEIEANNHFWREHRIKEADYYLRHHPRYSKLTGEPLKFKNREFYLSSDFNDKREMAKWFKENPEESKIYAIELLKRRKDLKGITYAPCQVELRSLMMPSMGWFVKNFGNYAKLSQSLGLNPKFNIEDSNIQYGDIHKEAQIVIDTREQLPFDFTGYRTIVKKLDYGDYSLEPNKFKVNVERKSLQDFVGTLSSGFSRFSNEIKRAKKNKAYLVVVVESTLSNALAFNHLRRMRFASKITPDYIFHNVRLLLQSYPNLQFLFCDSKKDAIESTLKIFSMKRHPKHIDLEFAYEENRL